MSDHFVITTYKCIDAIAGYIATYCAKKNDNVFTTRVMACFADIFEYASTGQVKPDDVTKRLDEFYEMHLQTPVHNTDDIAKGFAQ